MASPRWRSGFDRCRSQRRSSCGAPICRSSGGTSWTAAQELLGPLLERLPRRVYLSFDIDFFDPSLVPATGTPEPGGGQWYPTLALLREVFRLKEVVAMDVVELAPFGPLPASDFLTAKLIYKCLGYLQEARA